jgi:Rieske Fe-S protein
MAAGKMARRDLLQVLCASAGAVCGGVAACGGGSVAPSNPLVALPGVRQGEIQIAVSQFPQLLKVGGGLVGESAGMVEPLAIVREQENRFLAVRALCTHMACILNYNELNATFDCPCHGSSFELDGTVIGGPARQPLRVLPTRFDGTMLSVLLNA